MFKLFKLEIYVTDDFSTKKKVNILLQELIGKSFTKVKYLITACSFQKPSMLFNFEFARVVVNMKPDHNIFHFILVL